MSIMIIGVTGIFGSGKTTVAKMMAKRLRCARIDADKLAWQAFKHNRKTIKRLFRTTSRKKLGEIVFDDRKKLLRLQEIIHPYVLSRMEEEAKRRKNAVLDVPLLVETDAHKFADLVLVVKCSERVRIKRLAAKGFSRHEIRQRTRYQMPIKRKLRYADYVVDNSRSLNETKKKVEMVLKHV